MAISRTIYPQVVLSALAALLMYSGMLDGMDNASAKDNKAWKVDGKILGGSKKNGDVKKSEDVSGLACATTNFPRVCIAVDDESQGAQLVVLKDGELVAGDFIRLISDAFEGSLLELDAEGAAYEDGAFFVIGSHGRPRHEKNTEEEAKSAARAEAARHIFRISLNLDSVDRKKGKIRTSPEVKESTRVSEFIKAQADLAPWFDKPLEENGLTIEGIAARKGKLYIGLRAPVLPDGSAAILEVPIASVFDGSQDEATLHRLDLGKNTSGNARGVRDLIPYKSGFLVLVGPVNDPPEGYKIRKGDYTVVSWSGTKIGGKFDLEGYGKEVKPEGIVPLEEKDGKIRALVLFDGPEEGMPTPVIDELK